MRKSWLVALVLAIACLSMSAIAGTLEELEDRARSGNIDAQVELGYRYLHGLGVDKDLYKARHWLHVPAYEAQLPYAVTMLGLTYWDEDQSASDHQKALELFGDALELGDADAHIYLGWMIATGRGRTEDRDTGVKYIETGQELGADGAADMLEKLADMGTTVTMSYAGYVGCEIQFVTGEAYRAWRWTARQLKLAWTQKPNLDKFLCEQTENLPVSVTEYLGKAESEPGYSPSYYFAVTFDDCNMEFKVTRSEEGFVHKTTYGQNCHRYVPSAPPPSPSDFFSQWLDNMFGGTSSAGPNSSGSSYEPTYSYELLCADDRLFGESPRATIPLGQCTGYESECEYQLQQQLDLAGDYWSICSKTFGSNEWGPKGVRRQQ